MSTIRSPPFRGVPISTRYSLTARAALAHLVDQRQERAAEGHEIGERVAAEHVGRGLEEGLGRRIGLDDRCRRRRPGAPDAAARRGARRTGPSRGAVPAPSGADVHAALLRLRCSANRSGRSARMTSRGSAFGEQRRADAAAVAAGGSRSRYQPRCLRAQRDADGARRSARASPRSGDEPARRAPSPAGGRGIACRSRHRRRRAPGNHGRP